MPHKLLTAFRRVQSASSISGKCIRILSVLILITASISGCRDSENEKFRLGGGLYVTKKPTKQEKNIPSPFFPENSRVIESTEIKTPLLDSPESFAFVESDLSMDQLSAFYENAVKLMDWKLLQKSKEEKLIVFLAESQTRRILTVHIRENPGSREIRLFYRRVSSL